MTIPAWLLAASALVLVTVTITELMLTTRSGQGAPIIRKAITWAGVYALLALFFGLSVGVTAGWMPAGQFYAGYLTEYSLSMDNLFMFSVIMAWFAVPPAIQHRALLLGIGLALVIRSALIVAGSAVLGWSGWLFYPLGGILLWTAIGLITGGPRKKSEKHHPWLISWLLHYAKSADGRLNRRRLVEWQAGQLLVTPMLLLVVALGVADVLFAFDSIPAVFGITTKPELVVACNAFALMGLRQLYILLGAVLDQITRLNIGLGLVCAFIGGKLIMQALQRTGVTWAIQVPAWLSAVIVTATLLITAISGLISARRATGRPAWGPLPSREQDWLVRRFAIIDTDGNGTWQRRDCEQLTRKLCTNFGYADNSAIARQVAAGQRDLFNASLRHMDANGDGEITLEEFVSALDRPIKDQGGFDVAVQAAACALIRVADRDRDGVLNTQEYKQLAAVYGASPEEAVQAFGRLDLDCDGVLSSAELVMAITQFFSSGDSGEPGNVAFGQL